MLIRIDGAGATHEGAGLGGGQRLSYSVGFTRRFPSADHDRTPPLEANVAEV